MSICFSMLVLFFFFIFFFFRFSLLALFFALCFCHRHAYSLLCISVPYLSSFFCSVDEVVEVVFINFSGVNASPQPASPCVTAH